MGGSGLRVPELILGAMTFGEQGGVGAPLPECRRMLDLYAEAGGNMIDTAVNYRGGASEDFLGELLRGRRESFVLGTKYSVSRDPADPNAAGNHRKNLRASARRSGRYTRNELLALGYNAGPGNTLAFARGARPGSVAQSYLDRLRQNWPVAGRALQSR
ncbi:hypothetical protein GCM10010151_26380 [Actinoallomurus spadix]|uniref:NADP-dependent oxidoreductase domain-containing protein n=1 Tax=Actinoallomurus spadix TaxID=79912 RepID=A0ABN0WF92_9ACTN